MKPTKSKIVVISLIALMLLSGLGIFSQNVSASSSWLDSSWTARRIINIDNSLGPNSLFNYAIQLNVTYTATMNADFSDLRFTNADGVSLIPYWVESYISASSAVVWINVPTILALDTAIIYMYYGNPNSVSLSDGQSTFDFFDDFENAYVSGWATQQSIPTSTADCSAAVYDNKLYVFGGYSNTASDILNIAYEYNPVLNTWTQKD